MLLFLAYLIHLLNSFILFAFSFLFLYEVNVKLGGELAGHFVYVNYKLYFVVAA